MVIFFKIKWAFLALPLLYSIGCSGALLCTKKENPKQGLYLDFGKGYVTIGSSPTFVSHSDWVKKLIIKENGFLAVIGQKTLHCDNFEEIKKSAKANNRNVPCKGEKFVEKYRAHRYIEGKGYEEWPGISEKQWKNIATLDHSFSIPPLYHYENCEHKIFGGIYQLIDIFKRF